MVGLPILTCIDQHPKCNANCCRVVTMPLKVIQNTYNDGKEIRVGMNLNKDLQYYFKLRGFNYGQGIIRIPIKKFRIEVEGDKVLFWNTCEMLGEDLKCKLHGTERKPKVCQELDWDTKDKEKFYLTKHCIYK